MWSCPDTRFRPRASLTSCSGTRSWPGCRWAAVRRPAPYGLERSGTSASGSSSPASTAAGRWMPSELCGVSSDERHCALRPRPALLVDWQGEISWSVGEECFLCCSSKPVRILQKHPQSVFCFFSSKDSVWKKLRQLYCLILRKHHILRVLKVWIK